MDADLTAMFQERIAEAREGKEAIEIVGTGSKRFLGRCPMGTPLVVSGHSGIVDYEPSELVVTVRAGTTIAELEGRLAAEGQMLPFEPPRQSGTVGGVIASAWAGPRRPFAGSVRDALLGLRCLDGQGRVLSFGGRVVKNVAGFDVSRLMVGAMGTLGLILEATFRLLPCPAAEQTVCLDGPVDEAPRRLAELAGRPLPLSALAWHDGRIWARLAGSADGVDAARRALGGDVVEDGAGFWSALRDHRLALFEGDSPPLWRFCVPAAAPTLSITGPQLIDWGGALRWLRSSEAEGRIVAEAARLGGLVQCFRGGERRASVLPEPSSALLAVHRRIKQALDPGGIFSPGRLHATR